MGRASRVSLYQEVAKESQSYEEGEMETIHRGETDVDSTLLNPRWLEKVSMVAHWLPTPKELTSSGNS